jgi:hypothetical protein
LHFRFRDNPKYLIFQDRPFLKGELLVDTVTLAIITALTAGVASGATDVAKQVVVDLYGELKELLKQKYGGESEVIQSVNRLEANPESEGRKKVVEEEISAVEAGNDHELIQKAQALLAQLHGQPTVTSTSQFARGSHIYQANNNSQISISRPHPRRKGRDR